MTPSEPEPRDTSLELPDTPPAPPSPGTGLDLPPSVPAVPPPSVPAVPPPSVPAVPSSAPASPPSTQAVPPPASGSEPQAAPGPLGNLVVAHFRRVEIAMLGRVLVATLSGALPPSMVRVERRRKLFGGGDPVGVSITAGERTLTFRAPEVGIVEATVGHTVRGVTLSTTPVPIDQWLDELGEVLEDLTRRDEAARTALERALLT